MRFGDRLARLEDDVDRHRERQRAIVREDLGQVLPLQVFHDHVRPTPGVADVEHPDDVLAAEPGRHGALAREPHALSCVPPVLGQEDLDRDLATLAHVRRRKDDRHPAGADDATDTILSVPDVAGFWKVFLVFDSWPRHPPFPCEDRATRLSSRKRTS